MPILGRRVLVVGDSCAGKSTLAREIADAIGAPLVELDALHWRPGWQPAPPEAFRAQVDTRTRGDAWVLVGNYETVRDLSWSRADCVVWLDLALHVTLPRILVRSWQRARSRELLWGTNRERFLPQLKLWSPDDSLIAWTLSRHRERRRCYATRQRDPAYAHLAFHRLRSPGQVERWRATAWAAASDRGATQA